MLRNANYLSGSGQLDDELVGRLRVAVVRTYRRLRQEDGPDTTPSQTSALASLLRHGPMTIGELAALERVRPPTMTRIVCGLEEAGLIERRPDERDRRARVVAASAAGAAFAAERRERRNAILAAGLVGLDAADVAALTRAIEILERVADDLPKPVGRS